MNTKLLQKVKDFLKKHLKKDETLLLGVSGGPDSMALLYLLIECRRFFSFDLHLAHIDHNWRIDSTKEANILKGLARELNLPLTVHTLFPTEKNNLEDRCRQLRLDFFSSLYKEVKATALVLGHHSDDQAETVLKRLFEGSSLTRLGGLREETILRGMRVLRPLLLTEKKAIYQWLKRRRLAYFEDPTNIEKRFLRARMRTVIFPEIERQFGKKIGMNLARFGNRFDELRQYLDRRIEKFFKVLEKREREWNLDFARFYPMEKVELKHFLQKVCQELKITSTDAQIESLISLLEQRAYSRHIRIQSLAFHVHGPKLKINLEKKSLNRNN